MVSRRARHEDYKAGIGHQDSAVWDWLRAWQDADTKEEKEAWLRDHPGHPLPVHMCSLFRRRAGLLRLGANKREASEERVLQLKSDEHLIHLQTAWDAADKMRTKDSGHLRTPEAA